MKKKLILIFTFVGLFSCTNLDEEVFDTITDENFYKTERQVLAASGPAYSNLRAYTDPTSIWGLNTLTTDEIMLPTRGKDWFNGGIFQRLHRQQWTSAEGEINNGWNFVFINVTTCNRLLFQFEQIENKSEPLQAII